jgi:hypothetical protein
MDSGENLKSRSIWFCLKVFTTTWTVSCCFFNLLRCFGWDIVAVSDCCRCWRVDAYEGGVLVEWYNSGERCDRLFLVISHCCSSAFRKLDSFCHWAVYRCLCGRACWMKIDFASVCAPRKGTVAHCVPECSERTKWAGVSSSVVAIRYGLVDPGTESRWVGGDIFRTHPVRPLDPPSLLYNGYWLSLPEIKWPERGVNNPPSSIAEVKERLDLYLYFPTGPSWPVLGRTLLFFF